MKRITAITLFSVATFITLGSAFAQAQTVEAKIPFDFIVRNHVLPSGTYRIRTIGTNVVLIGTRDNPAMEMSTTYASWSDSKTDGKLVFSKYGDQYFLREILCESARISSALPHSKLEKPAQIREARLRNTEQTMAAVR
jgi:hypothetical protein